MTSTDDTETTILTTFESVIDDIALAVNVELPRMKVKPFRIPTKPTIVWHADDGSASVVLYPDATVVIETASKLAAPQLHELSSALITVQARLDIAILARAIGGTVRSDQ